MPSGQSQYEVGNVGPSAIVQQGENLSVVFSKPLWMRVKDFAADDESVTLSNQQPTTTAPIEMYGSILSLVLLLLIILLFIATDFAALIMFVLGGLALLLVIYVIDGAGATINYYTSSMDSKVVGILEKNFISTAKEFDQSSGYFLLSFVDKKNHRGTVKLWKWQADLVSVDDVGLIFLRAGRVINFLRSSRF
jgi:hypothetical protein